jgi:spore maturation protein CgeB
LLYPYSMQQPTVGGPVKILYVGEFLPGATSEQRARALSDLGFEVLPVSVSDFPAPVRGWTLLARWLYAAHLPIGYPEPIGLNAAIVAAGRRIKPDVLWLDKGIFVRRRTIETIRKENPDCLVIGFSPDDMHARHNRSHQFDSHLDLYDAFLTTKSYNVLELTRSGCPNVVFVPNGYDPQTHRPMPVDAQAQRLGAAVAFIGTYEPDRARSLRNLALAGIPVRVWGANWQNWRRRPRGAVVEGRAIYGDDYARAISASAINLAFLRKTNRDLQTTRSVEIPAVGGFMLAERTDEHRKLFEEGVEAEFFGSDAELIEKCRYYLVHPPERLRIAEAGRHRCLTSGYDYRSRLSTALQSIGLSPQACPRAAPPRRDELGTAKRSLRRRIWESLAATAFSRGVQIGYALVIIPVLLAAWGVSVYGDWIVLTALASFGSLASVGVIQASTAEIMLSVGAGKHEEASRISVTTLVGIAGAALLISAVVFVLFSVSDLRTLFGISTMATDDASIVVMLALASVVLAFLISPLSAALSVVVGAAMSTTVSALVKAAEFIAISIAVLAGGGPKSAATVLVASVVANVAAHVVLIRRYVPWLRFDLRLFDHRTFRELLRPSMGQMLLYASVNLLAIQLPRIILAHIAGTVSVAVFTVMMTYVRSGRTLTSFISQSVQVELPRAFAENRRDAVAGLLENLCRVQVWASLAAMLILLMFSTQLFPLLTHGSIAFDVHLFGALAIAAIIGAYVDALGSLLLGTNQVSAIAIAHSVAAAFALVLGSALIPFFGIVPLALALILPELATAIVGAHSVARMLALPAMTFVTKSLKWPLGLVPVAKTPA